MSSISILSKILSNPLTDPAKNWLWVILSEISGGDGYQAIFPLNYLYISERSRLPLETVKESLDFFLRNNYLTIIEHEGNQYGRIEC